MKLSISNLLHRLLATRTVRVAASEQRTTADEPQDWTWDGTRWHPVPAGEVAPVPAQPVDEAAMIRQIWVETQPTPPAPAVAIPTKPADIDPHADGLRAATLRLTREDAGTPPMADVPAATTVPPMPTWTPGSRFGMCRNPRESTR